MRALRALVEREEKAGNSAAAAMWAQRACALAPGDESWVCGAMSLLDRSSDTGGALRLHEAYARRLRAEFNAVPSAETESLAARIRGGGGGEGGQHQLATRPAPDQLPATERRPWRRSRPSVRSPRARRRRIAITAAAIGTAAIAIVLAVRRHRYDSWRRDARQRVLVEVFDNRTGDAGVRSLGRMAAGLDRAGAPPHRAGGRGRPARGVCADPSRGRWGRRPGHPRRHTGATVLVSGSYFRTGDTLFFNAAVTNAQTGRIAGVVGPIRARATRSPGWTSLRSRVMSAVAAAVQVQATMDIRGPEVPPFDAYKDYVDGWDAFWHGDDRRRKGCSSGPRAATHCSRRPFSLPR